MHPGTCCVRYYCLPIKHLSSLLPFRPCLLPSSLPPFLPCLPFFLPSLPSSLASFLPSLSSPPYRIHVNFFFSTAPSHRTCNFFFDAYYFFSLMPISFFVDAYIFLMRIPGMDGIPQSTCRNGFLYQPTVFVDQSVFLHLSSPQPNLVCYYGPSTTILSLPGCSSTIALFKEFPDQRNTCFTWQTPRPIAFNTCVDLKWKIYCLGTDILQGFTIGTFESMFFLFPR